MLAYFSSNTMNDPQKLPWITEFLAKNAWAIALVVMSIVAQWSIFSYRLSVDEKRLDTQSAKIAQIQADQNSTAVALAGIQKDIEYIRIAVDKLTGTTEH